MQPTPHSDRTYVPLRPAAALGYTPAPDEQVIEALDAGLRRIVEDMRRRRLFFHVGITGDTYTGRPIFRVQFCRVTLSVRVKDLDEGWVILGRAVEFELLAAEAAPQLRNPDLLGDGVLDA